MAGGPISGLLLILILISYYNIVAYNIWKVGLLFSQLHKVGFLLDIQNIGHSKRKVGYLLDIQNIGHSKFDIQILMK